MARARCVLTHGTSKSALWLDVPALQARLSEALHYQPRIEPLAQPEAAALTVVCEGRASATRAEFGVVYDATPYDQQGIAARLHSEHPHGQVAHQWFAHDGILAFLPLSLPSGNSLAMVWSVPQALATEAMNLPPEAFCARLCSASRGALGALSLLTKRVSWPLLQARASRWCGPGWALAGDAAHALHPLAGQGLNLGLGDAAELAALLQARDHWRALGDARLLRRYERSRKAATMLMAAATDGLQQLFARDAAPQHALRNWGMRGFERSGWLKQWATRQAMGMN
jgi:ubiquinone biosynthesis UbiH/UbiF/VisC/COQ6 family hydroxylase